MRIVGISRGSFSAGKSFADTLAAKLGYDCIGREELTDSATRAGIPVGKLEMAVVRRRPLGEQLTLERQRYAAFVAASLCERALKNSVVYHGRTGHAMLPGITQVLRVRVIRDPEQRIATTMERLKVSRQKAQKYNDGVDEDRHRWVRTLYNIDWQDPAHYDAVVNLSHVSVDNAASAMVAMAQLPEFDITPATHRALEDLLLASKCRLALGSDQRTRELNVQVGAERGTVAVTYLPRQRQMARFIPEVVSRIDGVKEVICTMASTNLLWIQERYDPQSQSLSEILEIAGKWNAAVELVQLVEAGAGPAAALEAAPERRPEAQETEEHGGILDDSAVEEDVIHDQGLRQTRERLIEAGHAGGYKIVAGGPADLLAGVDRTVTYSLVVVGDVFASKIESVRKRLASEMVSYLSSELRVPVIEAADLKTQFLFGPGQWLRLLVFGAIAAVLLLLVLTHQEEILEFTTRTGTGNRILSTACIFAFVPVFAYVYGNFTRYLLRLFKFE
jgi:cytidylate kinase